MNSRRISPVRSTVKAASGGALAIAAIIALLFFRGSGFGEAEETSPGDSGEEMVSVDPNSTLDTPPENPADPPPPDDADDDLTSDETKALSSGVLSVLIDERSFLLAVPTEAGTVYQPLQLDRAAQLAGRVPGDSNGIRVRILRRETARPSAEQSLMAELKQMGIDKDALYMPAEYIP